jgi:hypothetical protein
MNRAGGGRNAVSVNLNSESQGFEYKLRGHRNQGSLPIPEAIRPFDSMVSGKLESYKLILHSIPENQTGTNDRLGERGTHPIAV